MNRRELLLASTLIQAASPAPVDFGPQTEGHCCVCAGLYKLKAKHPLPVLGNHGYKRPGHGELKGKCPGVGFPPYELSKEGCEAWVEQLGPILQHKEHDLQVAEQAKTGSYGMWVTGLEGEPPDMYLVCTVTHDGKVTPGPAKTLSSERELRLMREAPRIRIHPASKTPESRARGVASEYKTQISNTIFYMKNEIKALTKDLEEMKHKIQVWKPERLAK